jgi:hypothetical protein
VISKTTKITHTVETGFAETTADKRSARSVIGPGEIPFYIFTLENQQTGETGFALTCGDNRIGNVLAVVEEGNYDDDHPFLNIFYAGLSVYIEDTIGIYNSITQADIENAMDKFNATRFTAPGVLVTDVGKKEGFTVTARQDEKILPVCWNQSPNGFYRGKKDEMYNNMYNNIVMDKYKHNIPKGYEDIYHYVTGCVPVAIAQIMAFHGNKRAIEGKPNPYSKSKAPGYTDIIYDWSAMVACTDKDAINAVGVLMYEIGLEKNVNASYSWGAKATKNDPKNRGGASTSASSNNARNAYINMGYREPDGLMTYNLSKVKSSIDKYGPVEASGKSKIKMYILGIPIYESGHGWVIDGYRTMMTLAKDFYSGDWIPYEDDYVHCNLGWGGTSNGWYISGVFDTRYNEDKTHNIPWADADGDLEIKESRSTGDADYYYKYEVRILTGIRPKD